MQIRHNHDDYHHHGHHHYDHDHDHDHQDEDDGAAVGPLKYSPQRTPSVSSLPVKGILETHDGDDDDDDDDDDGDDDGENDDDDAHLAPKKVAFLDF